MKISTRPAGYGTTPEAPARLGSVAASRRFLNALVTCDGHHIVYHRLESVSYETILDHYEAMDALGQYGDIYITIYHDTNVWIPPEGYLFDPVVLCDAEPANGYGFTPEQETGPPVGAGDFCREPGPWVGEDQDPQSRGLLLPLYLDASFGVTSRVENFPFSLLEKRLKKHPLVSDGEIPEILATVSARNHAAGT